MVAHCTRVRNALGGRLSSNLHKSAKRLRAVDPPPHTAMQSNREVSPVPCDTDAVVPCQEGAHAKAKRQRTKSYRPPADVLIEVLYTGECPSDFRRQWLQVSEQFVAEVQRRWTATSAGTAWMPPALLLENDAEVMDRFFQNDDHDNTKYGTEFWGTPLSEIKLTLLIHSD